MERLKFQLKLAIRHLSVRPIAGDALGSDITVSPIRVGQACDADAFAAGRIGEFAVTYIKSHMGNAASRCIEENKIADTKIGFGYRCALLRLACRCAGEGHTEFVEDVPGESGTIETCCGCTAVFVRRSRYLTDCGIDRIGAGGICTCCPGCKYDCCTQYGNNELLQKFFPLMPTELAKGSVVGISLYSLWNKNNSPAMVPPFSCKRNSAFINIL